MPTTPGPPHEYEPDMPLAANLMRGWGVLANTSPTDMSGHPALTMPCGEIDGTPVGLMAIARQSDDARLLALARTYQKHFAWVPTHAGDPRPTSITAAPLESPSATGMTGRPAWSR